MVAAASDLEGGRKRYRLGTHRIVVPRETLRRVEPLAPAMGVTRVADVTGLDYVGLPVAMAVRPLSRNLTLLQGKGADIEAARASALMEAAESHAAEFRPGPARFSSIARMPRATCIPRSLLARRLDRHTPIRWRRGQDLIGGKPIWVPEETALADFARPQPRGDGYFSATTNGLASGNSCDEALLHALCEVIERDAHALWRFTPEAWRANTGLNLRTVDDETASRYIDLLRRADIDFRVWSIASEINVPAFLCRISDARAKREPRLGRFLGLGCHPDPGVALCRALSEAAQSRLTAIVGARDDIDPMTYRLMGWPARIVGKLACGEDAHRSRIDFTDIPSCASANMAADVAMVLDRLAVSGIDQVAAVDLTSGDIGIPVLRVLVPELEGMQWRYGRALGARAATRLASMGRA